MYMAEHSVFDQGMRVNVYEIVLITEDLSYNKSPGLDGISSEHMKLADRQLPVLLAVVVPAMLTHSYVPKTMLKSVLNYQG